MNKRDDMARRASELMNKGAAPMNAARSCGFRNVSAMLAAISMAEGQKQPRTEPGAAPQPSAISPKPIAQAGEPVIRENPKPVDVLEGDPEMERLLEARRELNRQIYEKRYGAKVVVENDAYRVIRSDATGGLRLCQKRAAQMRVDLPPEKLRPLIELLTKLEAMMC